MQKQRQRGTLTVDLYTRLCLTVIAVLLTVLIAGLWADGAGLSRSATAAETFLNTAAQRDALIKAQDQTTEKVEELIRLLESGKVKVQVVQDESDKPAGGQDAAPAKKAK